MMKETRMRGIGNRLWLAAWLVTGALWPGVALAASTITGIVSWQHESAVAWREWVWRIALRSGRRR